MRRGEVDGTAKKILTSVGIALGTVVVSAGVALADYPPSPSVLGKVIDKGTETVAPQGGTAFTGSDTLVWVVAAVALLAVGAAALWWSRTRDAARVDR